MVLLYICPQKWMGDYTSPRFHQMRSQLDFSLSLLFIISLKMRSEGRGDFMVLTSVPCTLTCWLEFPVNLLWLALHEPILFWSSHQASLYSILIREIITASNKILLENVYHEHKQKDSYLPLPSHHYIKNWSHCNST